MGRTGAARARPASWTGAVMVLGWLLSFTGCRRPAEQGGIGLERMIEQPRADRYEATSVFADSAVMQLPPAGTVPWDSSAWVVSTTGKPGSPDTAAVLALGEERYDIFCAACHGTDGLARTPVALNMGKDGPPPLVSAKVAGLPPEEIYHHIADGEGRMPSYAAQLNQTERWAVVNYVRALLGQAPVFPAAAAGPGMGERKSPEAAQPGGGP